MTKSGSQFAAILGVVLLTTPWVATAQAAPQPLQTYRFNPAADTSIYSDLAGGNPVWDDVSDGKGESLWLSTTAGGVLRRALIRFDLKSIPAGQRVVSASLSLYESRSRADHDVALHRVLAPWGEGASNGGNGGVGAAAQAGDATWRWRDYRVAEWDRRGGDFVAQASAVTLVGAPNDFYSWQSSPGLVADVQGWLDRSSDNFGWILLGPEADAQNAKRFDSLQGLLPGQRPSLVVQTTAVPEASTMGLLAAGLLCLAAMRRRG